MTALDQHHVGSHRADHGPKHQPEVTANEGRSKPGIGERESIGIVYRTGGMTALLWLYFLLDWNGPRYRSPEPRFTCRNESIIAHHPRAIAHGMQNHQNYE